MISPVQSLNNSTEIIPVIETDVVRNERLQISLTNASNGSSLYEVLMQLPITGQKVGCSMNRVIVALKDREKLPTVLKMSVL